MEKLAQYIDHTLLSPTASTKDIAQLCEEAKQHHFKSICINPSYLETAKTFLHGSDVLLCTVIGFPLGQMSTSSKVFETIDAVAKGAQEIDMVMNIAKFKEGDYNYCINEINAIKEACGKATLKVIVETCLLSDEEKARVAEMILQSQADFIKTSTGFSKAGANLEDIKLWKRILGDKKKIKAAGGIRSHEDLLAFIEAGADRIGTSSGVKLINKEDSKESY